MDGVFADAAGAGDGSNGPDRLPGCLIFCEVPDNAFAAGIADGGFPAGFGFAGDQRLQSVLQKPLSPDAGGATGAPQFPGSLQVGQTGGHFKDNESPQSQSGWRFGGREVIVQCLVLFRGELDGCCKTHNWHPVGRLAGLLVDHAFGGGVSADPPEEALREGRCATGDSFFFGFSQTNPPMGENGRRCGLYRDPIVGETRGKLSSAVPRVSSAGRFSRGLTNVLTENSSISIRFVRVAAGNFCFGCRLSGTGVSFCFGTLVSGSVPVCGAVRI